MNRLRLATLWLDGCSGCHMSLLDMDERLLDLAGRIDLVYGPLVDCKEFPEGVDVTCIEGAVSSLADELLLQRVRARTRLLVALGDCALTGNVPALRNIRGAERMLRTVYVERPLLNPGVPETDLPRLNEQARPLHTVVTVDLFVPGCPPPADCIHDLLVALGQGRMPELPLATRFGA